MNSFMGILGYRVRPTRKSPESLFLIHDHHSGRVLEDFRKNLLQF
ncbi:MAG: hypothetical protein M0Z25_10945 [Nitrospiraceae bacterium]|nr:hypothetical protein [Nitrospiraceae bacterium]